MITSSSCMTWVVAIIAVMTIPNEVAATATAPKNILIWGAVNTRSIRLSMTPFMEALSAKGHNVTFITVTEDFDGVAAKKSPINIFIPKKWQDSMGSWESDDSSFNDVRKTLYGVPKGVYDIRSMGVQACEVLYSDPGFLEWVKASPKYDVVIVETLVNECAYGLVHLWNSKLVIYSTTSVLPGFPDAHGLPDESSSISDMNFGFPPGNEMTFIQRFVNALNPIVFSLTKEYYYLPKLEEITRKGWKSLGLGEDKVPSFSEVEKNASLVIITSHLTLDYPRSFPPNVVQIGGGVVTKKQKPLPKDIESFLNSAKNGFIYISFGTVVEFVNFDESTQIEFIKALEHFTELKFLWKSTSKINKTLPLNVLITDWVPQQTVLAHPNVKAFLTHAGMGGMSEAIHFSVPMICIPVLADQDHNARVIALRNAGIMLELVGLNQEQIQHAITAILHNDKYRRGMTRLTQIFKDRPLPPVDNAVWWVEYLLRHEDTNEFLLPPNVRQPWWKKRQIDIWITIAFLLSSIAITLTYISYKIIQMVLIMLLSKPKPKVQSKNSPKLKTK